MYRALIVGGSFDREGGKPSKIVDAIAHETGWPAINGGDLQMLNDVDFKNCDVLLWMPNIDNAEEKLLPGVKAANQSLLLISSKRVVEKNYTDFDVVTRLLKSKSNLGVVVRKDGDRYRFQLMDPLGNIYCNTGNTKELAASLKARVGEIKALTRIGSRSIGPAESAAVDPEFVQLVRECGDKFSAHVNAANPERFLGNASARPTDRITRCCHGFPAFREAGHYLVSRRNVDKATMSEKDFVAVLPNEERVEFLGDVKPSVDAPIQVRLFNRYPNVNYIVHGHVYIDGATATRSKVPCGHVEEFDEIRDLYPDAGAANFSVNLKGHGCLVLANDLGYLRGQMDKFTGRPFPEP